MLASALAASPRQLERAYDEIGLTTFGAHLRAVRLRNAAELLAHQPLTVTDVARLVGYRQPSHFVNRGSRQGRSATPPAAGQRCPRQQCEPVSPAHGRRLHHRPSAMRRPVRQSDLAGGDLHARRTAWSNDAEQAPPPPMELD